MVFLPDLLLQILLVKVIRAGACAGTRIQSLIDGSSGHRI
tara:strand:- start:27 stop:146 length:120 start_codon:yes stop_codon:yes gene_type:complete